MKFFEATSKQNYRIITKKAQMPLVRKWSQIGFIAKLLIWCGVLLIAFDNFDLLTPGSYYGHANWTTFLAVLIGMIIVFVVIPLLYVESYRNFRENERIWESEFFWILPSYVFGAFFIYGYNSLINKIVIFVSMLVLTFFHASAYLNARKYYIKNSSKSDSISYMEFCEYLTLYFLIFFIIQILFNPLGKIVFEASNF